MSNTIKREYDKLSLTKDIVELENIVYQFQITGFLDRNDAIEKITSSVLWTKRIYTRLKKYFVVRFSCWKVGTDHKKGDGDFI